MKINRNKQTVNRQTPNTSLEKKQTKKKQNKQTKTSSWFLNINLKKMKTDLKFFSFLY